MRQLTLSLFSHSKHFLLALGHDGLNNLLVAYPDKTAYAVCTLAYCEGPGSEPILFQGRTEGKIVNARGSDPLSWDAVFEHDGETYAEMDEAKRVSASVTSLSPSFARKFDFHCIKVSGDCIFSSRPNTLLVFCG